jgi:hypothetical protein
MQMRGENEKAFDPGSKAFLLFARGFFGGVAVA